MASASTFTPKASLTEAPTNLKEAIDWVLRVTGRDGKALDESKGECICGLAAAVTDLLQSVELEYHGYEGDVKSGTAKDKGASEEQVKEHLNGLFSLVQGLGGTAVVRTYIDQLAQVLSALVGWSKIVKCTAGGNCADSKPHGKNNCKYLTDITPSNKCNDCGCMKWNVKEADKDENGHHLGRGCTRCSEDKKECKCKDGGDSCGPGTECQCAKKGKCCKCCCKEDCKDKCKKNAMCSCMKDDSYHCRIYKDTYQSAYASYLSGKHFEQYGMAATWNAVQRYTKDTSNGTPSQRRHQCARILLGSVCLIWSGLTYMYWTGKYHKSSPRWNNHILDGSGLDDGTLSQWLQALGFPRDMLNNSGPKNRLDKVIWDGLRDMFFLGFPDTSRDNGHGSDHDDNTFRNPAGMNYAGYIHTLEKGAFDKEGPFKENGTDNSIDQNKLGAIFKLYILSCAYFTGLQKKTAALSSTKNTTPRTIREILYWLSALPYSQAYPKVLEHGKKRLTEVTQKPGESDKTPTLAFHQQGRSAPITVDEYNLFAHFQAVTQYCPLVLIGIQGGLHSSTDRTKEPAIHALYANTECNFTYPTVDIQAYNQVVHYIRALFYQLYFLRKQCAVKVTCGGKWRECRYGEGVVSKGVISWMCLGCNPMEHDRKSRVDELKKRLVGVTKSTWRNESLVKSIVGVLEKIGEVVVQLGNAQERLDKGNSDLRKIVEALNKVFSEVNAGSDLKGVLQNVLGKLVSEKVEALEREAEGLDKLKEAKDKAKTALEAAKKVVDNQNGTDVDPCKNLVSAAIHGLQKALEAFMKWAEQDEKDVIEQAKKTLRHVGTLTNAGDEINLRNVKLESHYSAMLKSINDLISICNNAKCGACKDHSTKCGKPSNPTTCPTCLQPTTTGVPSPLQAFLEDRLPGFSCSSTMDELDKQEATQAQKKEKSAPPASELEYPPAASHLGHCGGSGQCCPFPMGFRNSFCKGSTNDMTGKRLYGILYFFSNENMMQSCVYTLVRVTAALSATTPQVLGDVFGFFRGGVGNPIQKVGEQGKTCDHGKDPRTSTDQDNYFCGWCASGLRDEVKKVGWIPLGDIVPLAVLLVAYRVTETVY